MACARRRFGLLACGAALLIGPPVVYSFAFARLLAESPAREAPSRPPAVAAPGTPAARVAPAPTPPVLYFEVRTGERVQDWCGRLSRQGILSCARVRAAARRMPSGADRFLPPPTHHLRRFEGVFLPGRYPYERGEGTEAILARLIAAARRRYAEAPPRAQGLNLRQRMILASIVEKEAASGRQYAEIGAVFLNRLKRNMPLGSCPTVEYGLGYHRPFLMAADVRRMTPYNVYRRRGLPPTPIAFFTDEAWRAAAEPAPGEKLFFVYDWTTGALSFTARYSEHQGAAARARRNYVRRFGLAALQRKYANHFYESPLLGPAKPRIPAAPEESQALSAPAAPVPSASAAPTPPLESGAALQSTGAASASRE